MFAGFVRKTYRKSNRGLVVLGVRRLLFILLALDFEGSHKMFAGLTREIYSGSKRVMVVLRAGMLLFILLALTLKAPATCLQVWYVRLTVGAGRLLWKKRKGKKEQRWEAAELYGISKSTNLCRNCTRHRGSR